MSGETTKWLVVSGGVRQRENGKGWIKRRVPVAQPYDLDDLFNFRVALKPGTAARRGFSCWQAGGIVNGLDYGHRAGRVRLYPVQHA